MYRKNQQTISLSKNRHYLPLIIAAIVGLIGLYQGYSVVNSILSTRNQIRSSTNKLRQLEQRQQKLSELRDGGLVGYEEVVVKALPKEKPIFESVLAINSVAGSTEVVVANLETSPGSIATPSAQVQSSRNRNTTTHQSISLSLAIRGPLSSLNTFWTEIFKVAPLMDIGGVRVSQIRSQASSSAPEYNSEVELRAYWMPIEPVSVTNVADAKIEDLTQDQLNILGSITQLITFEPIILED